MSGRSVLSWVCVSVGIAALAAWWVCDSLLFGPDRPDLRGADGMPGGVPQAGTHGLPREDDPPPDRSLAARSDAGVVFVRQSPGGRLLGDVAIGSLRALARDPADLDVEWVGRSNQAGILELPAGIAGTRLFARADGLVSSLAEVPGRGQESTIWMRAAGDLRVRVKTDVGAPVGNARVSVARQGARITASGRPDVAEVRNWIDWPAVRMQATSDSAGCVTFRGLPPARYQIDAEVDGHARVFEPGVSPLVVDVPGDAMTDAGVVVAPLRAVVVRFRGEVLATQFSFTTVPAPIAPTAAICRFWQEDLAGRYPDCVASVFVHSRMAAGASEDVGVRFYARHGGWKETKVRSSALHAVEVVTVEVDDGSDETGVCEVAVEGLAGVDLDALGLTMTNTDASFSRRVTFGRQRVPAGAYRITCANPHTYSTLGLPWEFVVAVGQESRPQFRVADGTFGVRVLVMAGDEVPMDGWVLGVGVDGGDQDVAVYDSGKREGTPVLFRLDGVYRLTLKLEGFAAHSWSMTGQQILEESAGRVLRLRLEH